MSATVRWKPEEDHGEGSSRDLSKKGLACLQNIFDDFRKALEETCDSYALYRCSLTCDGEVIYAVLLGSDEDGNLSQLTAGLDIATRELYMDKVTFNNKERVAKELYKAIGRLSKTLPFVVGLLDFPIEGDFKVGRIMNFNKEPGTKLIYIDDSLDTIFYD